MGVRGAAAALLVVTLTAACADSSDSSDSSSSPSPSSTDASSSTLDPASLDGTTYTSISVEGRELVSGTAIELSFEDDTMSVWAGCNSMFGAFEVTGTTSRGAPNRPPR